MLGGAWTKQFKRAAADSVKAVASGKAVHAWCKNFGLPGDATFFLNKFGEHNASCLAIAWCDRLAYFYTLFHKVAREGFEYTDAMVNACPPLAFLEESAGEGQQVRKRLEAIMAMKPRAVCTRSSSGLVR